jgi:uncharacterized protein
MSHTPHELSEEFPDHTAKIHALKAHDAHFAKLAEEYHSVNRAVHRAETRVDLLSDAEEEALRKQRAHLKDHIWHHLKDA